MEVAVEGELHHGPLDVDTALTQGLQLQLGVTQGTMWLGMIIVLPCDLGHFHDHLLHVMRGSTGGPQVQEKMVGVPKMRGILHRVGH